MTRRNMARRRPTSDQPTQRALATRAATGPGDLAARALFELLAERHRRSVEFWVAFARTMSEGSKPFAGAIVRCAHHGEACPMARIESRFLEALDRAGDPKPKKKRAAERKARRRA